MGVGLGKQMKSNSFLISRHTEPDNDLPDKDLRNLAMIYQIINAVYDHFCGYLSTYLSCFSVYMAESLHNTDCKLILETA